MTGRPAPDVLPRGEPLDVRGGRPVVKVCGVTRVEDAVVAAELGAHAVGLVFWPESPRRVTMEQARVIARELPPFVAVVGVFVNQPNNEILEIARTVPLTMVQFHGDEPDQEVVDFPWRVIRAVSLESPGVQARLERLPQAIPVLLDAHDPVRRGGTGATTNWLAAADEAPRRRVILAGGLRPDNVREAIRVVRPWGLDVSSGVEAAPGVKDAAKLRAWFAAIAGAGAPPERRPGSGERT